MITNNGPEKEKENCAGWDFIRINKACGAISDSKKAKSSRSSERTRAKEKNKMR